MKFKKLYLNLLPGVFSGTFISEDKTLIKFKRPSGEWVIQPFTNDGETLNKYYAERNSRIR